MHPSFIWGSCIATWRAVALDPKDAAKHRAGWRGWWVGRCASHAEAARQRGRAAARGRVRHRTHAGLDLSRAGLRGRLRVLADALTLCFREAQGASAFELRGKGRLTPRSCALLRCSARWPKMWRLARSWRGSEPCSRERKCSACQGREAMSRFLSLACSQWPLGPLTRSSRKRPRRSGPSTHLRKSWAGWKLEARKGIQRSSRGSHASAEATQYVALASARGRC